ncbi:hypothetical protein B8W69_26960 [Mycobacterium vulneris]|uniref:Uncharacterized protein n=1 Tax=Mycolicibacterium vulneris TaxID=547163 RepID=A0A1X2KJY9_9MYCO|nr:hypothetical protein [Mycolicibacterium vulneris]OSC22096.1 hypothetical protein B8W69_26960 [Mycolicibacterium vulneris]
MSAAKTTTVVVRHPVKVTHAGVSYWPGDTAEVPATVAAEWVKFGYVDLVDEPDAEDGDQASQPEAKPKPKRQRRSSDA